jgi:hypothetical protein
MIGWPNNQRAAAMFRIGQRQGTRPGPANFLLRPRNYFWPNCHSTAIRQSAFQANLS